MGVYDDLGVRRVINAAAAQTKLGGSLMPPPVLAAMADAASAFVDLPELHDRIGARLAAVTRNEAACVCCGAAAGILVAVAACMVGDDPVLGEALPQTEGVERAEVIVFRGHRNGFLSGARTTGARLVEIGPSPDELARACSERTACVLWFAGDFWGDEALPLGPTVEIAHAHGVPVIVDAADQIPPVENLWRFTREQGVDLAIFSGGKGLRGPQASGLIVGRADLIRGCRAHLGPFHSIGRPAKVGKEELVGLLAAVEWSLAQDEAATLAAYRTVVDAWARELDGLPGIGLERLERSHCDQPIPRLALHFDGGEERRDAVTAALWERKPRIAVLPHVEDAIAINPQLLQPGDEHTVLRALREVVAGEV